MSLFMLIAVISLVIKAVNGGKKKRENDLRRQISENQMKMLNQVLQQNGLTPYGNGVPSFGNSMAPTQEHKKFSIGWIVFFVVIALLIFFVIRPYLEVLSVVGWHNFVDIFFSGKY